MIQVWPTEHDKIVELAQQGKSARHIKETLGLPITIRQVQRIMSKYRIYKRPRNGRLDSDALGSDGIAWRSIIRQLLIDYLGKNPKVCEQCGKWVAKGCDIHHTKYAGATLRDLQFVCRRCNTQPENVGLA